MALKNLNHTVVPINNGVEGAAVTVLDTGADITPEDNAMLMALHSRDPGGIASHLAKLSEQGSGSFMSNYYVGYGHGSIGDCGSTSVFVEGVSMLVAKALQDYPLYRGQECSTRYIDFSNQPFQEPTGSSTERDIYAELRSFYVNNFSLVVADLKQRYPDTNQEGTKYEKAIKARAFDILRGFLPAGATTNVAWSVDLRQARDRLPILRNHPLEEVRTVAESLEKALTQAHPNSFSDKRYPEQEEFIARWMLEEYYLEDPYRVALGGVHTDVSKLDPKILDRYRNALSTRPAKSELPKFLDQAGTVDMGFMLDFGSFRDIHRHRAVSIRMPLHGTQNGFEGWYLNQLPQSLHTEARQLLDEIELILHNDDQTRGFEKQYVTPMGYRMPISIVGGLPGLVYLLDLRSTSAVHPTLRSKVIEAGRKLQRDMKSKELGEIELALHLDESSAPFDTKRGDHDITKRD